jgi:hypothetical protein
VSGTFDAGDVMSSETYARERKGQHADVRAHREQRTVQVGPNVVLRFEDAVTVRYQLQEALRMEGISDDMAVHAEIDAYAALIPDGTNFKATFELGFADAQERRARTAGLIGIEARVWVQAEGLARSFAVAEASQERAEANRIPAVRYLRFELDRPRVRALKDGARLLVGIDHPSYRASLALAEDVRRLLVHDLR